MADYEPSLNSPIRDDSALGEGEDLDRQPDGMPHIVIAATVMATAAFAAILLMLLAGHVPHHLGATLAVAVASLVVGVSVAYAVHHGRRDTAHPSR
jgi:lysylphosphatidylglycerol synthetase-like protein (DUF2156 family)